MTDQDVADDLGAFLEALLFIAERPLTTAEIGELAEVQPSRAETALAELTEDLERGARGLRLQRSADEWHLVTAPEVGARLATYAAREEARLSTAALEAGKVIILEKPKVLEQARQWGISLLGFE